MPFEHGIIRPHLYRFRIIKRGKMCGDVLGDINDYRAGPAACSNEECFLDGRGDILHVLDQEVMFYAWAGNADHINFLKSIFANGERWNLAADDNNRNRIHVCGGDARDRIGRAWPGGNKGYADLTRGARV